MIKTHSNITVDQNRTQYVAGTVPEIPTDTVISILHTVEYRDLWWFYGGSTAGPPCLITIKLWCQSRFTQ
jgi:hypothetical protein